MSFALYNTLGVLESKTPVSSATYFRCYDGAAFVPVATAVVRLGISIEGSNVTAIGFRGCDSAWSMWGIDIYRQSAINMW